MYPRHLVEKALGPLLDPSIEWVRAEDVYGGTRGAATQWLAANHPELREHGRYAAGDGGRKVYPKHLLVAAMEADSKRPRRARPSQPPRVKPANKPAPPPAADPDDMIELTEVRGGSITAAVKWMQVHHPHLRALRIVEDGRHLYPRRAVEKAYKEHP